MKQDAGNADPNHLTVVWQWSREEFGASPEAFDVFWSVKDQWEAEYGPGSIEIIDGGGWEQQRSMLRRYVERGYPVDLAWMNPDFLLSYLKDNLLMDMRPYIDPDNDGISFEKDGVYPGVSASYTVDNKVYAAGVRIDPVILFFNEDMFREADLKTPRELYDAGEWDWTAFAEAARALTSDRNGRWGYGVHYNAVPWVVFLAMNGTRTMYPGRVNVKPGYYDLLTDLGDKKAKDALIFMREGYGFNADGSPGPMRYIWEGDYLSAFREGKIAMIAPSNNDRLDAGSVPFSLGAVPLPAGSAGAEERYGLAGYGAAPEGYCIPRTSAHPEAAAAFIRMACKAWLDYQSERQTSEIDVVYREAAPVSVYSPMADAYGSFRFSDGVNWKVFQWIRGPSEDQHPWNEGRLTLEKLISTGAQVPAVFWNNERLGPFTHEPVRVLITGDNPIAF
jgi:ABC-type glycerol-3-phosphate transport system substrate-binding protein